MNSDEESTDLEAQQKSSGSAGAALLEAHLVVPTIGTGTMRTSATWIAVMLMAEDCQAEILASVMKELGISPEAVADEYHDEPCPNCGISKLAHRRNGVECF